MQLWNKPYIYFVEKVQQIMEDKMQKRKRQGGWKNDRLSRTAIVKEVEKEIEKKLDF